MAKHPTLTAHPKPGTKVVGRMVPTSPTHGDGWQVKIVDKAGVVVKGKKLYGARQPKSAAAKTQGTKAAAVAWVHRAIMVPAMQLSSSPEAEKPFDMEEIARDTLQRFPKLMARLAE